MKHCFRNGSYSLFLFNSQETNGQLKAGFHAAVCPRNSWVNIFTQVCFPFKGLWRVKWYDITVSHYSEVLVIIVSPNCVFVVCIPAILTRSGRITIFVSIASVFCERVPAMPGAGIATIALTWKQSINLFNVAPNSQNLVFKSIVSPRPVDRS